MENRILKYFGAIAKKLSADHELTGTGKNPGDIGYNREKLLEDFLSRHLPQRLNVYLGGHIFGFDANVGAVFSVKSNLDSVNLIDALDNIASIPQIDNEVLRFKFLPPEMFKYFIDVHPTFYIFAYDGIKPESTLATINEYYKSKPVQNNRRPAGIIVNEKYYIRYERRETRRFSGEIIPAFTFYGDMLSAETAGLPFLYFLNSINLYVEWLSFMSINYTKYFNASIKNWYDYNLERSK